jgi:hypothetical protein
MNWIEQIIVYLKQLVAGQISVRSDISKLVTKVSQVESKETKLQEQLSGIQIQLTMLETSQANCCQMLNTKLDQILQVLIPPPPGPAVGFNVTVENGN